MMKVYWESMYETGMPEIDVQHQEILRLLNLVACSATAKQSWDILANLLVYLRQHFSVEEKYMPRDVETSREHKLDHERLAEAVADLLDRVLTLQASWVEKECKILIRDVLVEHTWRFDRPMAVASLQQLKEATI
jgi:hemerythrin-like metal-binding protein